MDIRCYSQRLLNPFRGAMNIIEYQGAEAVTVDGVHWDIYVRDLALVADIQNPSRLTLERSRPDMVGPHHFMIFMGQDVAVPYIATGLVEGHSDACDLAR